MIKPTYPPRVNIAHLPTPVEHMDRLSKHLGGPELLVKRDDQTGLATGGSKARKLEFLLGDALAHSCDHLITTGVPQSNHCRQTAAAAAHFGLNCSLVLPGEAPGHFSGNLLLNKLLGAYLYWAGERECSEVMNEVASEVRSMGRKPYLIPLSGSNVMGATGSVLAMQELTQQLQEERLNVDFVVLASNSGGTQAGLVLGAKVHDFRGQILGISVHHEADMLKTSVSALATATATHLGLGTLSVADMVEVNDDYVGDGFAQVGETEREAIHLVAQMEGIILDPVYTGRAMGALIDLIRWGAFTRGQTVLFWHTGGTAALPAYADKLL